MRRHSPITILKPFSLSKKYQTIVILMDPGILMLLDLILNLNLKRGPVRKGSGRLCGSISPFSPWGTKALCNYCKKGFTYTKGSRTHGTGHLRRHICNSYQVLHNKQNNEVEEPGFAAFVKRLQPQFDMRSVKTAEEDCVTTYYMEKQNLKKVIEAIPGHINLTMHMWSSCYSVGYVVLIGYFMDKDWNIQRKIINVVMEPYPHSDDTLSHAVGTCLRKCLACSLRSMTQEAMSSVKGTIKFMMLYLNLNMKRVPVRKGSFGGVGSLHPWLSQPWVCKALSNYCKKPFSGTFATSHSSVTFVIPIRLYTMRKTSRRWDDMMTSVDMILLG